MASSPEPMAMAMAMACRKGLLTYLCSILYCTFLFFGPTHCKAFILHPASCILHSTTRRSAPRLPFPISERGRMMGSPFHVQFNLFSCFDEYVPVHAVV